MIFRLFFFFSFLFAQEYYISFRFVLQNDNLLIENFNCAKVLSEKSCKKVFLFSLKVRKFDCNKLKEQIISYLLKDEVYVTSFKDKSSKVVVTYLPKLFDIIIKDDVAYFYECKE